MEREIFSPNSLRPSGIKWQIWGYDTGVDVGLLANQVDNVYSMDRSYGMGNFSVK